MADISFDEDEESDGEKVERMRKRREALYKVRWIVVLVNLLPNTLFPLQVGEGAVPGILQVLHTVYIVFTNVVDSLP